MPAPITAKYIVKALRHKHPNGALVSELTIYDDYAAQIYYHSLPDDTKQYYAHRIDTDFTEDASFDPNKMKFTRRIDALLLYNQKWTAFEIKTSRADFKRDTYEKRRAWMKHTDRFIYVTPVGLITKEEVPDGCGWWEVNEYGKIRVSKRAVCNKDRTEFPESLVRTIFWRLSTASRRRS